MASQNLNLTTIPLHGLHLIEASAGTGKTYTLVNLAVRAIVEQGIDLRQILIVTFSKAAANELQKRIIECLYSAKQALCHHTADHQEPILAHLQHHPLPLADKLLRLNHALAHCDQASIFTLHSFCAHILKQWLIEIRTHAANTIVDDQGSLRQQAFYDVWRRTIATAKMDDVHWLMDQWQDPDALSKVINHWFHHKQLHFKRPYLNEQNNLQTLEQLVENLRQFDEQQLQTDLTTLWADPALNGRTYTSGQLDNGIVNFKRLLTDQCSIYDLSKTLDLITNLKVKKNRTPKKHQLPTLFQGWDSERLQRMKDHQNAQFLIATFHAVNTILQRYKQMEQRLSFDDLLTTVADRLTPSLATTLRNTYPLAFVDEFQDTDAVQYRILKQIYYPQSPQIDHSAHTGLFLIGDPKQAIYSFRGANVFMYLQACQDIKDIGHTWTMQTNWRADFKLVHAINRLFNHVADPFLDSRIPFHTVGSRYDQHQPSQLIIDGQQVVPLEWRWLPETLTEEEDLKTTAADDCATRIKELLHLGATKRAYLYGRPLTASDIKIIVRSHSDGHYIRKALTKQGIASVTLNSGNIFSTQEATDFQLILTVLVEDNAENSLRILLATDLFGWTATALSAQSGHEAEWEAILQRFSVYRQLWRKSGFLSAFWYLIQNENIGSRLRQYPDGERRLTNLLHLAELAHQATHDHAQPMQLLYWLQQCIVKRDHEPNQDQDINAHLLRLETDAALVAILTIHKSKGLEFPIVIIPFPWTLKTNTTKQPTNLFYHDAQGRATIDFDRTGLQWQQASAHQESDAENRRLFYVALTRAKQLCITYWSDHSKLNHQQEKTDSNSNKPPNALTALLQSAGTETNFIKEVAQQHPDQFRVVELDDSPAVAMMAPSSQHSSAEPLPKLQARTLSNKITAPWRVRSFSAWARQLQQSASVHTNSQDEPGSTEDTASDTLSPLGEQQPPIDFDPLTAQPAPPDCPSEPELVFPAGSRPGTCLHDILQYIHFDNTETEQIMLKTMTYLKRYGFSEQYAVPAYTLIMRTITTPLDDQGFRLCDLAASDRISELKFHFAITTTRIDAINQRLQAHNYPDLTALTEDGQSLQGLMTGFIDLVFRVDDRFYFADYKSNLLGDNDESYNAPALAAAMQAHHYHLQALIYTIALHRYLTYRVKDYRYQEHFGGYYYLFLRGMWPERGPSRGIVYHKPPVTLIEELSAYFTPTGEAG
jgi:exodeoxyribonuclease V beta subunit